MISNLVELLQIPKQAELPGKKSGLKTGALPTSIAHSHSASD
jgi:hypothetical protein